VLARGAAPRTPTTGAWVGCTANRETTRNLCGSGLGLLHRWPGATRNLRGSGLDWLHC